MTDGYDELVLSLVHRMSNIQKLDLSLLVWTTKTFVDGGIFTSVRRVSLFDERSFEHEFFLRIAQSFPFMEKLTLINNKRQNNKQFGKSKNKNQDLSIIEYPYLIELDLTQAQKDYYEQFLFDTKICLTNNVCVNMDY
ncbi:unnamed protein product [Rotaria sordida]|nr:unnamed protein product [Rotaria sordida]